MSETYLEIQSPEGVRKVPVTDEPVTVGRHSDNVVPITDQRASRFHCVIERSKQGFRLRDLKSSNGTFINGLRVESADLMPGEVITIGATNLVLYAPDAADNLLDTLEEVAGENPGVMLLGEEDIVEAEELPPLPRMSRRDEEDAPLKVVRDDGGGKGGYEAKLRQMAAGMLDQRYTPEDIALISGRGQVVHKAGEGAGASGEAVDILRLLLLIAARGRATDIHIEPKAHHYHVRMRVDGSMVDVIELPTAAGTKVAAVCKILSDIDISQRNAIQEGHFAGKLKNTLIDYRMSFAPSVFGQKLVLRVLDPGNAPTRVDDLRMPATLTRQLKEAILQDAGMVLVCGPTGSGKTSTLYSLIRSLRLSDRNVVTIEDPVEIQLDGVTQIPVDESQGKSFSTLLKSVLRQDPDVILVGEVRDAETARTAIQAAMTGHLVFSTVHTKDTVGTIFRLMDLGLERYLIAQGLQIVVAQRLVRQLCPACKRPVVPSAEQLARLGPAHANVTRIYEPAGCPRCLNTGHAGRRAIFELLTITEELRELITKTPTAQEIYQSLGPDFLRLMQSGYNMVAQGAASFAEIERAVGR